MTPAVSFTTTPVCRERIRLSVRGVVQGMGFRSFFFRLAHELSLAGWVANTGQGAILELKGEPLTSNPFRGLSKSKGFTRQPAGNVFKTSTILRPPTFPISIPHLDAVRSVVQPHLAMVLGDNRDIGINTFAYSSFQLAERYPARSWRNITFCELKGRPKVDTWEKTRRLAHAGHRILRKQRVELGS